MRVSKVLELHSILKDIGKAATPMRMTVARNLLITTPIVDSFIIDKDAKFNDLVQLDEQGDAVLKEEVVKAIAEGKINPQQGLPFGAYAYESNEGLEELIAFLDVRKEEEKEDITFIPISLSKPIRLQKDEKEVELVPLSDLLEAPDSLVTSDAIALLMEVGILID